MSDVEENNVTLPIYCLHIIGAGYFILIALVIYLIFKKSCKNRRVYNTFENENEQNINQNHIDDNEVLFISHFNKMNNEFQESENKINYTIVSEGINENMNIKNSAEVKCKENLKKSNRAIDMINRNNRDATVFIPPDIMQKICVAVLEKNKITNKNDDISNKECNRLFKDKNEESDSKFDNPDERTCVSELELYDIIKNENTRNEKCHGISADNNEELSSKSDMPLEKTTAASDSEIYDIITNNKLVKVRISTSPDYLNHQILKTNQDKSSCFVIRDSNQYVFPMITGTSYVNANPVNTILLDEIILGGRLLCEAIWPPTIHHIFYHKAAIIMIVVSIWEAEIASVTNKNESIHAITYRQLASLPRAQK